MLIQRFTSFLLSIFQVQYIALRDTNGNYVSADSTTMLGELNQEQVSEEKVCFLSHRPY